jgi:hypothetical protein
MVDIDVNAELKRRQALRQQKVKRISQQVPLVRILPATDSMRRMLKHPDAATQFGKTGSVEWPMDQFTQRRLREGAIRLEDDEQQSKVKVRERATPLEEKPIPEQRQAAEQSQPQQRRPQSQQQPQPQTQPRSEKT